MQPAFTLLLALGVVYPGLYEFHQWRKVGSISYFGDLGNYSDCLYNWASLINIVLQNILGPYHIVCRLIMSIIVL